MIKGVLGNEIEITSCVSNFAGHISNYIVIEMFNIKGDRVGLLRLEKEEALSLKEELNNKLSNLI